MSTYDQIATRERNYLLNTYARYPLVIARGKGVHVYDIEGRRYLDFVGGLGVNALGHAHPRIVKVIREQAAKVIHISNLYYNEYQGLLAEKLCTLSGLDRAFFSNSGTEAIEGALKLVRAAGLLSRIVLLKPPEAHCSIITIRQPNSGRVASLSPSSDA